MGTMSLFFLFWINLNPASSSPEPMFHGVLVLTFLYIQLDILKEIEPPPVKTLSHPSEEISVEVGMKNITKAKTGCYLFFSIKENLICPFQVCDFDIYRLKIYKISIILRYKFCHLST